MSCQERVECLKNAMPAIVMLCITVGALAGILLILLGHLNQYAGQLDKLIGTLMLIAGLQGASNEPLQ